MTKKAENEELEEYAKANERGKVDGFVCLCVCVLGGGAKILASYFHRHLIEWCRTPLRHVIIAARR